MNTYTSGELAKRVGVNAETIRYYERIGLLSPSGRRASGYRVYFEADVNRLGIIRSAKSLGFTLREIARLLCLLDDPRAQCDDIKGVAINKVSEIKQRILELTEMQDRLQSLIDRECPPSAHLASCRSRPALERLAITP